MLFQCFIYTAGICVLVLIGFNIHICLLGSIIILALSGIVFISSVYSYLNITDLKPIRSKVNTLLRDCFSLCIGITLSIYVGNIPQYLIDACMDEEVQAIFGYIMMPVFVVTLLNQFIYQPTINELGDLWNRHEVKKFKSKVFKQCLIVGVLAVIITVRGLVV